MGTNHTVPLPILPLQPVPRDDWQTEFDILMEGSEYLRKKYSRERLVREKQDYIDRLCPEVMAGGLNIVDIGCGFGVFAEVCRYYGNECIGIETPTGEGGMGGEYLALGTLLAERQKLTVVYRKWQDVVAARMPFVGGVDLFSSQGSWEQCYAEELYGPPHHTTHDCTKQFWKPSAALARKWFHAFAYMASQLREMGHVLIWANGSRNHASDEWMDTTIRDVAKDAGFKLVLHEAPRLWKWRKEKVQ